MLKFFQGLSKLLANYTSIFVIGVAVFNSSSHIPSTGCAELLKPSFSASSCSPWA